ncbi:helix-turn-helix domain-containing protein [Paenactinomyces guangxiensis]|uniref:Tetratricopeptide repeat protein n=1 Tax=Paenactinomyces guangxiensis TaxID=1490290 RepID=A0A7W1WRL5_9BACL|nr:tetratricopeptide repeat protein [Paenactinomyces guangxiensis]MBA4494799.1 tetratricopeptide repeat protein [Paenactinomyces guangxiensis]MBH8591882.1 tetratricopeptide repeat protein [Paenactinomyces guangxiensis]
MIGLELNIRRRRKELKMTQAQLAEGIISVPYLSLIENGKATPGLDILELLATRLDTSVEQLMGITDQGTIQKAENLMNQIQSALTHAGYQEAKKQMEKLKSLAKYIADPKILMEIDLLEINLWVMIYHEDKFVPLIKAFEAKWSNYTDDPSLAVKYFRIKGNIEYLKSNYHHALEYYRQALKLLPKISDEIEKGYIYSNIGKAYLLLANPALSIVYMEKALQIMMQNDHWLEVCSYLNIIGSGYSRNKEYDDAIRYFERVVRICKQFRLSPSFMCQAYHEMGICFLKLGDYDLAIHYLNLSHQVCQEGLPPWEVGIMHKILALVYIKKGDFSSAESHIRQAMKLCKDHPRQIAECSVYLGQIRYAQGNFAAFEKLYSQAISIFESLNLPEKIAGTAHVLGEFFTSRGKEKKACPLLLKAARHYREMICTTEFDASLPVFESHSAL